MLLRINAEIFEIEEKIRKKKKLSSHRQMLLEIIEKKEDEILQLEKTVAKERDDVTRLQERNFNNMMRRLFGTGQKKLSKERQEYLEAKAEYDKEVQELASLERRLQKTEDELEGLAFVDDKYEDLLVEKRALMILEEESADTDFARLVDKVHRQRLLLTELEEAILSAKKLISTAHRLRTQMLDLRVWGATDFDRDDSIAEILFRSERLRKETKDLKIYGFRDLDYDMIDRVALDLCKLSRVDYIAEIGVPSVLEDLDEDLVDLTKILEMLEQARADQGAIQAENEKELDREISRRETVDSSEDDRKRGGKHEKN